MMQHVLLWGARSARAAGAERRPPIGLANRSVHDE
jgi:hypothetical protein